MKRVIKFAVVYNGREIATFSTERVAKVLAEYLNTKVVRVKTLIAE